MIIGNTGAEVLTTMLSWVQGAHRLCSAAVLGSSLSCWGLPDSQNGKCVLARLAGRPKPSLCTCCPSLTPALPLSLPCTGALTQEEQEAMIASLKSASRSTAFEQWLGAVRSSGAAGGGGSAGGSAGGSGSSSPKDGDAGGADAAGGAAGGGPPGAAAAAAGGAAGGPLSHQEELAATLAEVAEYLAQQGIAGRPQQPADPSSIAADSSSFK